MARVTGEWVMTSTTGEAVRAFVPYPLPPVPPVDLTSEDHTALEFANQQLGRLDGLASLLPDVQIFLYLYIRKEAVLSSQIEGTQSTLGDLLRFESQERPGVPLHDVQEASNYVAAMNHGLTRLREGFPLSLRLIKEIHEILLSHGRGSALNPGEFRRSQNWLGGSHPGSTRFVPPPPDRILECLNRLETFIHDDSQVSSTLIKAALVHVQFETIHPFLDGNGRLGRLLTTLLLCSRGVLQEPILYLSLYFKLNRAEYYERLQAVREQGRWEEWIHFFVRGVSETAGGAVAAARRTLHMFEEHRTLLTAPGIPGSALRVFEFMKRRPMFTIARLAPETGLSIPTVGKLMELLSELGLVEEVTGQKRGRIYIYQPFYNQLIEDTEPLPR